MPHGIEYLFQNMAPQKKYDRDAIFKQIFERMSQGESSRSICRSDGMPCWAQFMNWLAVADKETLDQYAQARERMIDAWVLDAYDTAHDESRDYQTVTETIEAPSGTTIKTKRTSDNSASMRDRLKVDTILKVAAKLSPKKYGDLIQTEQKITVEHEYVDRPEVPEDHNLWLARVKKKKNEKPPVVN